jgi:hypothetical protein
MDRTLLSLYVHVPFVTMWIGLAMLDSYATIVPGLEPGQRARMISWSRPFTLLAIAVILVTGIVQTIENPFLPGISSYAELERLREGTYGLALFWKHGFVLATFGLTLLVRFFLAPRITMVAAGDGGAAAAGSRLQLVRWLSLLNLAACLGALVMTTLMLWQLH